MPTYEYRCENGHDFEEFVLKMSAAKSELPCPTCGTRGQRHLSAGGALVFKGSGFYITDYGKDGKKAQRTAARRSTAKGGAGAEGATKADAPPTEAKAESKSEETKPAATSTTTPSRKRSE